jgi:recombination protein RecT
MTDQTAIQKSEPKQTGMERVKSYMMSAEVKERFTEMMGEDGNYYLNQVMMVVASSEELQKCEPASILISAIRAATLKLSVDPSSGQAWIIPYGGKATFQVGYKGIYDMAMRTNRYRIINVGRIYEGEILVEDRMTGLHSLEGGRTGDKTVGWLLYFELTSGFKKTFYMSVPEITAHAEHYSKAYHNPKSKWNDPFERWKMERKTVLINGLRQFGVFNSSDKQLLDKIEEEQGWTENEDLPLEGEVTPYVDPKVTQTTDQLMNGIGQPAPKPAPEPVAAVAWPGDYGLTIPTMANMGDAENELNEKGVPYVDIDHETLKNMAKSMMKKLNDHKHNVIVLEEVEIDEKYRKLSAIKTILTAK